MSALRLPVSGLCPVDSAEKGKPDVLVVKPRWRPGRTPLVSERRRSQDDAGQRVTPDRFSPTTPARISPIDTSFSADTDSPRARMPTAVAPAAPMPVHSAYAGPTSSRPTARLSSPKLISAHAAKPTVGHSLVKCALCFSSTANAVSNRPAITIRNHAMGLTSTRAGAGTSPTCSTSAAGPCRSYHAAIIGSPVVSLPPTRPDGSLRAPAYAGSPG